MECRISIFDKIYNRRVAVFIILLIFEVAKFRKAIFWFPQLVSVLMLVSNHPFATSFPSGSASENYRPLRTGSSINRF
ncbi:hypothetical protein DVK01_18960 [Haloarcula sp. Atlit-120R]|nr:hypothetical protein DVK01_18960 [Haloarcula sp. Atlit-120R]